jgi:hypothetical protein
MEGSHPSGPGENRAQQRSPSKSAMRRAVTPIAVGRTGYSPRGSLFARRESPLRTILGVRAELPKSSGYDAPMEDWRLAQVLDHTWGSSR